MEEIEFSVFDHGADALALLRSQLAAFEARHRVHVHLSVVPFAGAWARLLQMALYEDGPDVSAVGTSWVGDFVRMNALRPYSPQEIRALGGAASFFEASWRSAVLADDAANDTPTWWAVPWLADTRIVCYRRDLFERADLDPTIAFQSPEYLDAALTRLQASGLSTPLVIPTRRSRITLHNLATWIWGAGGDFFTHHTAVLAIDQAATVSGLKQYLRLGRFLSPEMRDLDDSQSDEMFRLGRAAVTFSGYWLLSDQRFSPVVRQQLGVARMPGVPFVGGHHLIVWRFSRKASAAIKLVKFLAGHQAPAVLFPALGLPARRDLLAKSDRLRAPPFDLLMSMLAEGRTFPSGRVWGVVEKHFVDLMPVIWRDVLASPDPDLDAILRRHLLPLAQRLRLTLGT